MVLDIICHVRCQFGRRFSPVQPRDALCVIQQHPVLQIRDPFRRGQQLALLNIRIAERKRVVCLHAALDRRAGGQRDGDDKQIFSLPKRLTRHDAPANCRSRRDPLLQRCAVPLAHHAQQKLLQIVGVVLCLLGLRRGGKPFLRLPPLLSDGQCGLLLLLNADVLQLQPLLIQYIIDRAQHLQHAFHRHADDAPHTGDQSVCRLAG